MKKKDNVGIKIKYKRLLKKELFFCVFLNFFLKIILIEKTKKHVFFLSKKSIMAYVKKKIGKYSYIGLKLSKISSM